MAYSLSITVTLASHGRLWAHACRSGRISLSWECVMLPSDVAQEAVREDAFRRSTRLVAVVWWGELPDGWPLSMINNDLFRDLCIYNNNNNNNSVSATVMVILIQTVFSTRGIKVLNIDATFLQDSSTGNTSDGDSQDSGVQSKGKSKDALPRTHQHKSVPGYKVEDKSPWYFFSSPYFALSVFLALSNEKSTSFHLTKRC